MESNGTNEDKNADISYQVPDQPIDEITVQPVDLTPSPSSILDLSTDLDGLSLDDAKEYVASIMAIKKQYEKDIQDTELDRFDLKGTRLNEQSEEKKAQLTEQIIQVEEKLRVLVLEEMELSVKLELMIESLKKKKTGFQPSNNPQALLDSMEKAVGKSSSDMKLEKDTQKLELERRLEELKGKMDQKD